MYLGSTGPLGLAHLAFDLMGQGLAAHVEHGATTFALDTRDGALVASYDGPELEPVVLDRLLRGMVQPLHPTVHVSTERIGLGVVMALSSRFTFTARARGRGWQRVVVRGVPVGPPTDLGPHADPRIVIRVEPDAEIFGDAALPMPMVANRLQQLAVLNPNLHIEHQDTEVPSYGGLAGYAAALAGAPPERVAHAVREDEVARIEVAAAWGDGERQTQSYAKPTCLRGSPSAGIASGAAGHVGDRSRGLYGPEALQVARDALLDRRGPHEASATDAHLRRSTMKILASQNVR